MSPLAIVWLIAAAANIALVVTGTDRWDNAIQAGMSALLALYAQEVHRSRKAKERQP
jgi:uncharacterized membrane protein YgaE (UPF0421/DUF939 family)